MMVEGEDIFACFKSIRDMIIFTNKRIVAVNVQGITGSKKDFTSLPYSKVQAFSVETAGTLDLDCELVLWFSGLGKVKFEFKAALTSAPLIRCWADIFYKGLSAGLKTAGRAAFFGGIKAL